MFLDTIFITMILILKASILLSIAAVLVILFALTAEWVEHKLRG